MRSPSSSSRISKPWVKFLVEEHLKQQRPQPISKVEIKDFNVSRGTKVGDGYNSELVALDINASMTEDGTDAEPAEAEFHFIVKFLITDAFTKVLHSKIKGSLREYIINEEYIKDLNAFWSSHASNGCQISTPCIIHGKHNDKESILVMENLKYDGYENNDKYKGLDSDHLKEAVIEIARFHALSYAYDKTQQIINKYPFFQLNSEILAMFAPFLDGAFSNGIDFVRNRREEVAQKMETFKGKILSDFTTFVQLNPAVPNCIIHGDYWNNNIMYKYRETEEGGEKHSSIASCKIIDWGNPNWGSPVMDLQYLIKTSTTRETREEHLEAILQCYHTTYTEVMADVGMMVPNWTYDDFLKEWQRLEPYGIVMGLTLCQGTLSKAILVKPKEPSILDSSFCIPGKFIVDGMKKGMAKMVLALILKPSGQKLMLSFFKKITRPVREELLSGSNEVMCKRVLDLVYEAYENGTFDEY